MCQGIVATQGFVAAIFGSDNCWHQHDLAFDKQGVTLGLHELIQHHTKAAAMWEKLRAKPWCQWKLSSLTAAATLWDLLLFMMFAKAHQGNHSVWVEVCQLMWAKVLRLGGALLDAAGLRASKEPIQPVPLLKTKRGFTKRIPMVNKLVMLHRVKKKCHRRVAMGESSRICCLELQSW